MSAIEVHTNITLKPLTPFRIMQERYSGIIRKMLIEPGFSINSFAVFLADKLPLEIVVICNIVAMHSRDQHLRSNMTMVLRQFPQEKRKSVKESAKANKTFLVPIVLHWINTINKPVKTSILPTPKTVFSNEIRPPQNSNYEIKLIAKFIDQIKDGQQIKREVFMKTLRKLLEEGGPVITAKIKELIISTLHKLYQSRKKSAKRFEEARKATLTLESVLFEILNFGGKAAEKAKAIIVESNGRFLAYCAAKNINQGLGKEDLINEGTIAILLAMRRFKPDSIPFSTFAGPRIKGAMRRACTQTGRTIRIPANLPSDLAPLEAELDKFWQKGIENPTNEEMVESGFQLDLIERSQAAEQSLNIHSLETVKHLLYDSGSRLPFLMILLSELMVKANLTERQREVIKLFYLHGHTLDEIAEMLGCGKSNVKQHKSRGLSGLQGTATFA